jgi:hypothetical protein
MQGFDDRSTPSLFNIFVKEFLARLGERNEPPSATEADVAGPWAIEELRYTCYGLYRRGESSVRGHRPAALCKDRALALLAAAALPGTGRDPLFHLQKDPTPEATPSKPEERSSPISPTSTRNWSRPSTSWNAS